MKLSCLLVAAALLLAGRAPRLIDPPFVRKWTALVGDQCSVVAVRDGSVYTRSQKGLGALDLATGARRWSALPDRWIAAAALQGKHLIAVARTERAGTLVAVDVDTHQPRT